MKRTSPLQKYAAQFSYEHKNMGSHFSGIRKHANELSKTLDNMFPKEKRRKKTRAFFEQALNFRKFRNPRETKKRKTKKRF